MDTAVKEYYGETLKSKDDLQTNACKCSMSSFPLEHKKILSKIHDEITNKFYGCGSPLPYDLTGCTVVDLGCGTGRDVYLASALVGPSGKVYGVDMTDQQLSVARKYIDYHTKTFGHEKTNVEFINGSIEKLPFADNSIDVVISNCVINLSLDKKRVFEEIHRVLKPGGEFLFSDVFADRRIPEYLAKDAILYGECLTGALYIEDFRRLSLKAGFTDYRILSQSPIVIENTEIKGKLEEINFQSITIRTFKLPSLEDKCEDYEQTAQYLGTIKETPNVFNLDNSHQFEKGKLVRVCGNTADMLSMTRYKPHFEVSQRNVHKGLFDCSNTTDCNGNGNGKNSCC